MTAWTQAATPAAPLALQETRARNVGRSLDHLEERMGEGRVDLRSTGDQI